MHSHSPEDFKADLQIDFKANFGLFCCACQVQMSFGTSLAISRSLRAFQVQMSVGPLW